MIFLANSTWFHQVTAVHIGEQLMLSRTPGCRLPFKLLLALTLALRLDAAERLEPADGDWFKANYTKAERQIPMRDGVKLCTAIFSPKASSITYPIWIIRTPYGIGPYGADKLPTLSGPMKYYAREKFIFVVQDVRGRNASEGEFVQVRPLKSAPDGTTDESTDAWDTIDWLVKNVPNNNGKAGLSGVSYPGFYAICGAINSHPALTAVSPQAPVADWFLGDDYHHNGALYLSKSFGSSIGLMPSKPTLEKSKSFDFGTHDGYAFYLTLGPLAHPYNPSFESRPGFWNDILAHGTYDDFWKARNPCAHLTNIHAAVLTVGGWYDAEDLYGTLQVYHHVERQNPGVTGTLVMGPWVHGGWQAANTQRFGPLDFGSNTFEYFRQCIELPFFKHFLKGSPEPPPAEAVVFETGVNRWRRFSAWPPTNRVAKALYFHSDGRLAFDPAADGKDPFDEYVSDPAKPVPYISGIAMGMTREHMIDDQRFAATRPDVLVYQTAVLEKDETLAGPVVPDLRVLTTGTDSDRIVKLIDVYPADYPNPEPNPLGVQMGGYQQLVRAEPMRGKFRNSFEKPEPFEPGKITKVAWGMPDVFHTFRRGHRIMVQVQSAWFPLVDCNPQTFCDIYQARPEDFRKATQRVFRNVGAPSAVRVNVLPAGGWDGAESGAKRKDSP